MTKQSFQEKLLHELTRMLQRVTPEEWQNEHGIMAIREVLEAWVESSKAVPYPTKLDS